MFGVTVVTTHHTYKKNGFVALSRKNQYLLYAYMIIIIVIICIMVHKLRK